MTISTLLNVLMSIRDKDQPPGRGLGCVMANNGRQSRGGEIHYAHVPNSVKRWHVMGLILEPIHPKPMHSTLAS